MVRLKLKIFTLGLAGAFLCAFPMHNVSHASDITVGASINARAVISATKGLDMNFGNVNFDAVHTGEIQLGTDGNVQLGSGTSGLSLDGGSPSAGDLTIAGDGRSTIEISCETSGVLGSSGANTLNLQNVQFSIDVGQPYGAATACNGLGTAAATIDLASNASPKIFLGGALDVSGNAIATSSGYSTANAGGDPITLRVVYQ